MTFTIKVEGLAELDQALFELGDALQARNAGKRALMTGAAPMVAAIQRLAPKEQGFLAESVEAQPARRNRGDLATVLIGINPAVKPTVTVPREEEGQRTGPVEDLGVAGVGPIQEFGTPKMAANPFFRPGFDAEAAATVGRVGDALRPEIEEAARRVERKTARLARRAAAG